jgi:hypothetical protein
LEHLNQKPNQPHKSPWLFIPFLLLLLVIFSFVGYRNLEAFRARNQIRQALNAPDSEFAVTVNGRPWPDKTAALSVIRSIHLRLSHHSHPGHEIMVVIKHKDETLNLTLARDSAIPDEYWIFWTSQEGDLNRPEIGRIQTSLFDSQ